MNTPVAGLHYVPSLAFEEEFAIMDFGHLPPCDAQIIQCPARAAAEDE
jgi:hypothetical protein